MEIALIESLKEYFIWQYALFIIVFTEVWKRLSVKHNNKWYIKIDYNKLVGFNLRVLTVLSSFVLGVIIALTDTNKDIIFDLLITFGLTSVFYEYIYKTVIKALELNNYERR